MSIGPAFSANRLAGFVGTTYWDAPLHVVIDGQARYVEGIAIHLDPKEDGKVGAWVELKVIGYPETDEKPETPGE